MINDIVLKEARKVLREFPLCDSCLGRLYVKKLYLSSSKILGRKIKTQINYNKPHKCFICKDLLDNLDCYLDELFRLSENTNFLTFLVGVILKPSLMDKDDLIRSKFKTRGIDSIKTEITKHLTSLFAKRSKKSIDPYDPDLTFLVNFRTDICQQRFKSLLVSGRYTKTKRGLPQKQRPCSDCNGQGCIFCNNHGIAEFNSVEGIIAQFFYKHYGCTQVKITWIGGEDKDSLVNGDGRLFFARLSNPKRRNSRLKKHVNLDSISLTHLHKIKQIPMDPIKFQSHISLQIKADSKIPNPLLKLKQLTKTPILISDGSKFTKRNIHAISYKKTLPDFFTLNLVADGGISMKKLVDGQGIQPNVSALLGVNCTCIQFDFENIIINDNN